MARCAAANAWFNGVSTDSRSLSPGDLFVAIKGERFDGHDFVSQAFARGATAAIVAADRAAEISATLRGSAAGTMLCVSDPPKSLGALATFWRRRFSLPVVGIVGSNGKTTVKEMTAAILRAAFGDANVLATSGNLNNEIGLPLTVLRLHAGHRAASIEIGMNHPGETAVLSAIASPSIGVINNAQREHQEFMHSVADVAAEHASLLGVLPYRGHRRDQRRRRLSRRSGATSSRAATPTGQRWSCVISDCARPPRSARDANRAHGATRSR